VDLTYPIREITYKMMGMIMPSLSIASYEINSHTINANKQVDAVKFRIINTCGIKY